MIFIIYIYRLFVIVVCATILIPATRYNNNSSNNLYFGAASKLKSNLGVYFDE